MRANYPPKIVRTVEMLRQIDGLLAQIVKECGLNLSGYDRGRTLGYIEDVLKSDIQAFVEGDVLAGSTLPKTKAQAARRGAK